MGTESSNEMVTGTVTTNCCQLCGNWVEAGSVLILNIALQNFSALTGKSFSASIDYGCFSNENTKLLI